MSVKLDDFRASPEVKKDFNERHFNEAAHHYNFATRAMSLMRDSAWKKKLVAALPDAKSPFCVDLACGTGDVSLLLEKRYPGGIVVGLDISESMLRIARKRKGGGTIRYINQDMSHTGFDDESVDIVTGSYALRNAPDIPRAVQEIWRILKPGGTAGILDFSKPSSPFLQKLTCALLKCWCGLWGFLLHGNPTIHGYVGESLKVYPERRVLRDLFRQEGFEIERSRLFYLGIIELIIMRKKGKTISRLH